jgi:hypothetical protein
LQTFVPRAMSSSGKSRSREVEGSGTGGTGPAAKSAPQS